MAEMPAQEPGGDPAVDEAVEQAARLDRHGFIVDSLEKSQSSSGRIHREMDAIRSRQRSAKALIRGEQKWRVMLDNWDYVSQL